MDLFGQDFRPSILAGCLAIAMVGYLTSLTVYRLYLHPLAKIPGPRIAAITYLYEIYYDVWKAPGGQYWHQLETLHKIYGPIVRINPEEVQIQDPEFFTKIYAGGAHKRDRWTRTSNASAGSMASTVPHDLHRLRRSSVNSFFSKSAVLRLEERVQKRVELLGQRLSQILERGEIIDISIVMTALTLDVVTGYAFGESWDSLKEDDFGYDFVAAMRSGFKSSHVMKLMNPLLQLLPPTFFVWLDPKAKVFVNFHQRMLHEHAGKARRPKEDGTRTNMFTEALDRLPEDEKTLARLTDETLVAITAGAETTGRALTAIVYHVLANPMIHSRLLEELDGAMGDERVPVAYRTLESLPYLTAIVREALRISALTPGRSLLVAHETLNYKQWKLEPGTPICMNLSKYHLDETLYSEPTTFDPERWLGDAQQTQQLLRHFSPFSKGHRGCLGMNLAYAELYIAAAYIFRYFSMQLYDVDRERDVDAIVDAIVGLPGPESKGVKIKLLAQR